MSMCPQYSASSRVLIFSRIARWRSTSRYIGVSRKSRVPLVRGRFLSFVMPDQDGVGLRKRLERTGHELFVLATPAGRAAEYAVAA